MTPYRLSASARATAFCAVATRAARRRALCGGGLWRGTNGHDGSAMQPAEIQFAQRLASHEKGIRDRAVKKLRQYISVKTQKETGGRRRSAAHMAAGVGAFRGGPGWGLGKGARSGGASQGTGRGAAGGAGRACGTESHSRVCFCVRFLLGLVLF